MVYNTGNYWNYLNCQSCPNNPEKWRYVSCTVTGTGKKLKREQTLLEKIARVIIKHYKVKSL